MRLKFIQQAVLRRLAFYAQRWGASVLMRLEAGVDDVPEPLPPATSTSARRKAVEGASTQVDPGPPDHWLELASSDAPEHWLEHLRQSQFGQHEEKNESGDEEFAPGKSDARHDADSTPNPSFPPAQQASRPARRRLRLSAPEGFSPSGHTPPAEAEHEAAASPPDTSASPPNTSSAASLAEPSAAVDESSAGAGLSPEERHFMFDASRRDDGARESRSTSEAAGETEQETPPTARDARRAERFTNRDPETQPHAAQGERRLPDLAGESQSSMKSAGAKPNSKPGYRMRLESMREVGGHGAHEPSEHSRSHGHQETRALEAATAADPPTNPNRGAGRNPGAEFSWPDASREERALTSGESGAPSSLPVTSGESFARGRSSHQGARAVEAGREEASRSDERSREGRGVASPDFSVSESLWPELPDSSAATTADEWAVVAFSRERERLRRLNDEQKGTAWSA